MAKSWIASFLAKTAQGKTLDYEIHSCIFPFGPCIQHTFKFYPLGFVAMTTNYTKC